MSQQKADLWRPEQYLKFQDERSRPFWDLGNLVDFKGVKSMLDVGCGTGELTHALHVAKGVPQTTGIDSSAKMLAESGKLNAPGLRFEVADVESFAPTQGYDVVFSNAALQWVESHPALFTRLLSWVNPNGMLAVQMPVNFDHPSHLIADEVGKKFALKLRGNPVLALRARAGKARTFTLSNEYL